MFRKAVEKETDKLKQYLLQEPVYNTFLLADLETYGFDKDYQKIYVEEINGDYRVVYLTFYNNLILAGEAEYLNKEFVNTIKDLGITVVMGRKELVDKVGEFLQIPDQRFQERYLYSKEKITEEQKSNYVIQEAQIEDVDQIYDFLMSIEFLKNMYRSKDMLHQRIKNKEGMHVFVKKGEDIIAHANTTARAEKTVMIGGVGVREEERGKGLASSVVSYLAESVLKENKIPCLFSTYDINTSFMRRIGFKEFGKWGTLELVDEE